MNRPSHKPLSLLAFVPCLAAACGPAQVTPASTPAISAPIVVAPAASTATARVEAMPLCIDPATPRPSVVRVTDWLAQDFVSHANDPSEPVRKACDRIAKRGEAAVKDGPGSPDAMLESSGRCFGSAKGAWAIDVSKAGVLSAEEHADDPGFQAQYELTYVAPDGSLHKSSQIAGQILSSGREQVGVEVVLLFDYDGDGASEIVVKEWSSYGGEEYSDSFSLLTFQGGEVKPYAPATDIEIHGVVDVDRDGRPDLVIPGPFAVSGPCGLDGQQFRAPPHVAHALPSGAFSLDDAIAKEAVREQCGPIVLDLVAIEHEKSSAYLLPEETARRITCARIYGMPAKEAVGRVRAAYPFHDRVSTDEPSARDPGFCLPLARMLELAAQTPLFTTEGLCPER